MRAPCDRQHHTGYRVTRSWSGVTLTRHREIPHSSNQTNNTTNLPHTPLPLQRQIDLFSLLRLLASASWLLRCRHHRSLPSQRLVPVPRGGLWHLHVPEQALPPLWAALGCFPPGSPRVSLLCSRPGKLCPHGRVRARAHCQEWKGTRRFSACISNENKGERREHAVPLNTTATRSSPPLP